MTPCEQGWLWFRVSALTLARSAARSPDALRAGSAGHSVPDRVRLPRKPQGATSHTPARKGSSGNGPPPNRTPPNGETAETWLQLHWWTAASICDGWPTAAINGNSMVPTDGHLHCFCIPMSNAHNCDHRERATKVDPTSHDALSSFIDPVAWYRLDPHPRRRYQADISPQRSTSSQLP